MQENKLQEEPLPHPQQQKMGSEQLESIQGGVLPRTHAYTNLAALVAPLKRTVSAGPQVGHEKAVKVVRRTKSAAW
jgi:hypothetical protein